MQLPREYCWQDFRLTMTDCPYCHLHHGNLLFMYDPNVAGQYHSGATHYGMCPSQNPSPPGGPLVLEQLLTRFGHGSGVLVLTLQPGPDWSGIGELIGGVLKGYFGGSGSG